MFLNRSVGQVVHDVQALFEEILHRSLYKTVYFDHGYDEDDISYDFYDSYDSKGVFNRECACMLDCSNLAINEASQYEKYYSSFLRSIMRYSCDESLKYTFNFGPSRVLEMATAIINSNSTVKSQLPSLEVGGGSGMGFQLFCNDEVLLTSGFGGGGGLLLQSSQQSSSNRGNLPSFTFGGGGGGGLQLLFNFPSENSTLNTNVSRYSIGGGGGCGNCDDSKSNSVHCGYQLDDDAISSETLQSLLSYFTDRILPTCKEVQIRGGGGGGGGTGGCCTPYHVGYGFRFVLSTDPVSPKFPSNEEEEGATTDTSPDSEANIKSRYTYDLAGWLLDTAAEQCRANQTDAGNQYQADWCCRCSRTQQILNQCTSLYPGNYWSLCEKINSNPEKVRWMANQACCASSTPEENDPLNGGRKTTTNATKDANDPEGNKLVQSGVFGDYDLYWTTPSTNFSLVLPLPRYKANSSRELSLLLGTCPPNINAVESLGASNLGATISMFLSPRELTGCLLLGLLVFAAGWTVKSFFAASHGVESGRSHTKDAMLTLVRKRIATELVEEDKNFLLARQEMSGYGSVP